MERWEMTVILLLSAFAVVQVAVVLYRNAGKIGAVDGISKWELWLRVRPMMVKAYQDVERMLEDGTISYQEAEDHVAHELRLMVEASPRVSELHKSLLTEGQIRRLIRPSLELLYKQSKAKAAQ